MSVPTLHVIASPSGEGRSNLGWVVSMSWDCRVVFIFHGSPTANRLLFLQFEQLPILGAQVSDVRVDGHRLPGGPLDELGRGVYTSVLVEVLFEP